jgi:RimJ/RimL family protein N-acetyltransferase
MRALFDLQPTLTGKLVHLRPLEESDFEMLYAVASDKKIWEQHYAWNRFQRDVFERFFADGLASGGALIIEDVSTGEVIGSSRYNGYNAERSEIEIGWTFLARSHWGGVYNREMKKLMLDHAFRFVNTVILHVALENYRSQKAVEKIGGVRSGIRKDDNGVESFIYKVTP